MVGPLSMTLPQLLKHWAEHRSEVPALVFRRPRMPYNRTVLTFQDLYTLGSRCAALLRARGVRRGDVVIVLLPNSPERAVVEAALILLAAFSVSYTCDDPKGTYLLELMRREKVTAVVLDPDLHWDQWQLLRGLCQLYDPRTGIVTAVQLPDLYSIVQAKRQRPENEEDFLYFLRNVCSKSYTVSPEPLAHDSCAVLTTACGEGRPPKLVVQTHQNMVAFSKIFMPRTDASRPVYFVNYPFGSVRGHLSISLCNPVTRILLDEGEGEPASDVAYPIFKAITKEKCSIVVLPPHVVQDIATLWTNPKLELNKLFFVGFIGEATGCCDLETALKFSNQVLVSYVSAELLMAATTVVGESANLSDQGAGYPLQPGIMVKVLDDEGNVIPEDMMGTLLIRSPTMFKGYLNDTEATESSLDKDGYFKTGDVAHIRNGRLFVVCKV